MCENYQKELMPFYGAHIHEKTPYFRIPTYNEWLGRIYIPSLNGSPTPQDEKYLIKLYNEHCDGIWPPKRKLLSYDEWFVKIYKSALEDMTKLRSNCVGNYCIWSNEMTKKYTKDELDMFELVERLNRWSHEVTSLTDCSTCGEKCKNPFVTKCGHIHCLKCICSPIGIFCGKCQKVFKYSEMIRLFH